mmetsp:Transcript_25722/g.71976  ORF Transcript_25722/g.71976 Transcript_25722/m.71976 type:complete len:121 (-) Transcript_25722:285-647(-)
MRHLHSEQPRAVLLQRLRSRSLGGNRRRKRLPATAAGKEAVGVPGMFLPERAGGFSLLGLQELEVHQGSAVWHGSAAADEWPHVTPVLGAGGGRSWPGVSVGVYEWSYGKRLSAAGFAVL